MIKGLTVFSNRLRWREYFRLNHKDDSSIENSSVNSLCSENSDREFNYSKEEWDKIKETDKLLNNVVQGLGTKFRSTKLNRAPRGSINLENFLADLNRELITKIVKEKGKSGEDEMSKFIKGILNNLNEQNKVLVPTDKTNSYVIMSLNQYRSEMTETLNEVANVIEVHEVKCIKNQAIEILEKLQYKLSKNEFDAVKHQIDLCVVPTPRLLVKDHKKTKPNGSYPGRLVVPAQSFNSGFSKLDYTAIKDCFDRCNIVIDRFAIVQASSLKEKLEMMNVNKNVNSIASIDIVNFYPSVSYQMIEKAVWHFAKKIKGIERERLKTGLKLLKTGMSKQIVQFDGTYYKYKGNDPNDPGLTIGGYESAFGSDLVVLMLLDIIEPKLFTQIKLYNSINP